MARTPERMSIAQLRDIQSRASAAPSMLTMRDNPAEKQKRGQKYGNTKVLDNGIKFDSKAEHKRYLYLRMLELAGEIKDLRMQVAFELIPAMAKPSGGKERPTNYLADFVYHDGKSGAQVVEDVKGAVTPEFRLKRKLMLFRHGIEVKEIRS